MCWQIEHRFDYQFGIVGMAGAASEIRERSYLSKLKYINGDERIIISISPYARDLKAPRQMFYTIANDSVLEMELKTALCNHQ